MSKISQLIREKIELPKKIKIDFFDVLILTAPIAIWFSYWPQISLGSNDTMNFKLTITIIFLTVLALTSLYQIFRENNFKYFKNSVAFWLVSTFSLFNLTTIFWSNNHTRTLLTSAIIFCLYFIFMALFLRRKKVEKLIKPVVNIYLFTAIIMGFFALIQFIYGMVFVDGFGLCAGCVSAQFGFVRPNVFAIEPQFFGSMLLPATLIILHEILTLKNKITRNLSFGFLIMILILTLSRGAIFAFGFGAIIVLVLSKKESMYFWKNFAKIIGIGTSGVVFALFFQGLTAVINPNVDTTFASAVGSSVNHLSMGIIDISELDVYDNNISENEEVEAENKPAFEGYVEESTDVRTSLTITAFNAWKNESFAKKIFGVGLGGSGVAMARFDQTNRAKEIVQNEYVEILLEIGMFGAILFVIILACLIYEIWKKPSMRWTIGIVAAFGLQWMFFSGYPSAIHIYFTFMVLFFAKIDE